MLLDAFDSIRKVIGDIPFTLLHSEPEGKKSSENSVVTTHVTKNVILKDGTYASVTSTEITGTQSAADEKLPFLRKCISMGDILLGTVACVALTKIALKSKIETNRLMAETVLIIAGVGKVAELKRGSRIGIYADCLERLTECARILLDPVLREKMCGTFLSSSRNAFTSMVAKQKSGKSKAQEESKKNRFSQADDLIQFRQLRAQAVQGGIEVDLMDADDISRAIGAESGNSDVSKLKHIYQLTGFSDPVYAEASVVVHDYDIVLDILIVNRTPNTLTNLTVELATMGDLKLVERPQPHTIGPLDERRVRANIKVSSTETSHIFGTIVFDNSSTAQKTYVNLHDIQLDIMDYIRPADCKNEDFRSMWAEFEWENKVGRRLIHRFKSRNSESSSRIQVAINTNITDLQEFIAHVISSTNMTSLTPLDDHISVSILVLQSFMPNDF
jgi:coatomer subunit beta